MSKDFIKLPRLYVDAPLDVAQPVALSNDQAHYLRSVLRKAPGDRVRLFNGRDGEWIAALTQLDKKGAVALPQAATRLQSGPAAALRLLCAPIKKARFEWLIEKAVELGVTHIHPVITQYTENRHINEDRLRAQIIEAAEQCERLELPILEPVLPLQSALSMWNRDFSLFYCAEREENTPFSTKIPELLGEIGLLIGPEGGFSEEEGVLIAGFPFVRPVSLGSRILRAETAVCAALALVQGARVS